MAGPSDEATREKKQQGKGDLDQKVKKLFNDSLKMNLDWNAQLRATESGVEGGQKF